MNWKNVVRLISVDVKSGRLIRGHRFRRYRESKLLQYALYGGSCILGVTIGGLIGYFYSGITNLETKIMFHEGAVNLFLSLPTLVLVYSLTFNMMGQIRRAGVKASIQPLYWLPITWEEHTLASILANLMGFSLASIILIGSVIVVASIFLGEVPLAVFAILTFLASAFLGSTTTEIFRILQVRFIGAVYKSSGRAAVWLRFLGSILFLVIFYLVWFSITSGYGSLALIKMVTSAQGAAWFIPYVWLGMVLTSLISGLLAHTVIFSLASFLFILILFYVAVKLNNVYGLYEPPAITVSRGAYAPKVGFLGKLGFSPLEAAVIRKDFKAFTRRRELMYIFVMPLVFIIMPLMQFSGAMGPSVPLGPSTFLFAWVLLTPGAVMAVMLGVMIIGEEGRAIWHFYSLPITAQSLVKCKYAFVTIFSCVVMLVCGVVGILVARPSPSIVAASLIESILLIFALGAVSLRAGVRGADFVEVPRPRMVRPTTALVNMLVCFVLALAILSPLIPYAVTTMGLPIPLILPKINLFISLLASGVIALIVTYVFYRRALKSAEEFLKTEV